MVWLSAIKMFVSLNNVRVVELDKVPFPFILKSVPDGLCNVNAPELALIVNEFVRLGVLIVREFAVMFPSVLIETGELTVNEFPIVLLSIPRARLF